MQLPFCMKPQLRDFHAARQMLYAGEARDTAFSLSEKGETHAGSQGHLTGPL